MLQQSPHPSLGRSSLTPAELSSPAELLDYFVHFLRQQYLVILVSTLLMICVGGVYLLIARPNFIAVATMLIDTRKSQSLQQQPSYTDAQTDSAAIESQVRVLRSDNIALAVIKKLQLFNDPEFVGSSSSSDAGSDYGRMREALAAFKTRLDVARDTLSYAIEVRFRSYDADKSAAIANAVVDAYITDQMDSKYQSALRASNWLEDRIRDLRDQTSAAEQAVVDYEQASSIVSSSGKTTNDQQVSELNTQLLVAKAQVEESRAKLDRIQTVLTSDSGGTVDATVTDAVKNEVVSRLRTQYLDLANKEHDWSARYGKDHLAVVNLRNQMAQINAAIIDEVRQIAGTYKSDFEIAKQHADALQKSYNDAIAEAQKNNQAKVILNDLQSKAKTYRELYESFLQRYTDSVQQQSFPITEAHLISPALRPLKKSSPRNLLTLAISACIGVILGFGIGVFRDLWNRVFRTTEQAEKLLHVPCITLVPALKERDRGIDWATTAEPTESSPFLVHAKSAPSAGMELEWPLVVDSNAVAEAGASDPQLLNDDASARSEPHDAVEAINKALETTNNTAAETISAMSALADAQTSASAPAKRDVTKGSGARERSESDKPAVGAAGVELLDSGSTEDGSATENSVYEELAEPAVETTRGKFSDLAVAKDGVPENSVSEEPAKAAADAKVADSGIAENVVAAMDLSGDASATEAEKGGFAGPAISEDGVAAPKPSTAMNSNKADEPRLPGEHGVDGGSPTTKLPRVLKRDANVLWTVIDEPFSRFAESLRVLKVAIALSDLARSNKVIGFTSSLPNEGKSTLAAALALLIAQSGGRVVLVDCDLRNPSLTQTLAPTAEQGYIELVSKKVEIEDVQWFASAKINLPFIPCVIKSRVAHTSEILASSATKDLFAQLRRMYDYVIVDLSPMAPVVDVRTTTNFIDSYVCVVEWGRTKIDVVKKILADTPGVYQNLIGTVLNKADIGKLARYDAHRGNYYNNKHYTRYGYID
jgi:capsular exopolysaccharide synthesis family protein